MKKISFTLIALLLFVASQAQLRYKKIYPEAMALSREEAFDLFLEYQKQDPEHVNTYYQLGLIALHWMQAYDPLVSYKDVKNHSYNAKLFLGLARHKLTEKSVRSDREYFQGIRPAVGTQIEYADVKQFLDSTYARVEFFEGKVSVINQHFYRSIDFYNAAVEQYKAINARNARLKDMLLTADPQMEQQAHELKQSFDSSMIYFQHYKNELKSCDMIRYDQELDLRPITTYRLEGLAQQNFLLPKVLVYNYGAWVDTLLKTLHTDVVDLRKAVAEGESRFDAQFAALSQANSLVTKEKPLYRLTNVLEFKIGKFDNNSLMNDWFRYRDAQADFLGKLRNPLLQAADTQSYEFERRAKHFESVVDAYLLAGQKLAEFGRQISPAKTQKYPDIFVKKYGGPEGLGLEIEKQQSQNQRFIDQGIEQLHQFYVQQSPLHADSVVYLFKKTSIPGIDTTSLASLPTGGYKTTAVVRTQTGTYLAGLIKNDAQTARPFVAFSADGSNIDWLTKVSIAQLKNSHSILLQALPKGCVVLINGQTAVNGPALNVVQRYDEFGSPMQQTVLQSGEVPQAFLYDDMNEEIFSVLKGANQAASHNAPAWAYLNKTDGTAVWATQLNLVGRVGQVLKMDQSYALMSEFESYNDGTNTHQSAAQGSNLCTVVLSNGGQNQLWHKYPSSSAQRFENAYKLSSNTICLFGSGPSEGAQKGFVYLLLDAQGTKRYGN